MPSKISREEASKICLSCGECCKRYWITILPDEARKISKTIKLSLKQFLEEECILLVRAYPKSTPGVLTYPTAFLPKNVYSKLSKYSNAISYFIVPQVVLKRYDGICTFLDDDNKCVAYSSRPEPCKLFPFIAVEGYRESYPFCKLFKATTKNYSKQSLAYSKKLQRYFALVDKKGFLKVWKTPPKKGLLFHADNLVGEITLEEINEIQKISK